MEARTRFSDFETYLDEIVLPVLIDGAQGTMYIKVFLCISVQSSTVPKWRNVLAIDRHVLNSFFMT